MTQELFRFLRVPLSSAIGSYVTRHTTRRKSGRHSTSRNSKETAFRWRKEAGWPRIREIQSACAEAMEMFGYARVESESELQDANGVNVVVENKIAK